MKMTWRKLILCFLGMAAIATAIMILGPMLSHRIDQKDRERVDQHPSLARAKLTRKRSWHGVVVFRYDYNGKTYLNSETNEYCYHELSVGDSIDIKLDSLHPGNSYILSGSK